jgi:hypothetical protein
MGSGESLPIFHFLQESIMATSPTEPLALNEEEQRIYERLSRCFDEECKRVAKLLAGKDDGQLFGQTEYDLRDRVHALGAKALEAVADERQKKGRLRKS